MGLFDRRKRTRRIDVRRQALRLSRCTDRELAAVLTGAR